MEDSTRKFAKTVYKSIGYVEEEYGSFVDIIAMVLPVILPYIERCLERRMEEEGDEQRHAGPRLRELASEAQEVFGLKFMLHWNLRRTLGRKQLRRMGGRLLTDAIVARAAQASPILLTAMWVQCKEAQDEG